MRGVVPPPSIGNATSESRSRLYNTGETFLAEGFPSTFYYAAFVCVGTYKPVDLYRRRTDGRVRARHRDRRARAYAITTAAGHRCYTIFVLNSQRLIRRL